MISVIIPVYKVEAYIDECLQSVINQTYKDLEIIIVDDGSPDNCAKICDDWKKRDSRIVVLHKSNGGLSSARNAGLTIATGDYISFVDGDDIIAPEMYEKLLQAQARDGKIAISSCMLKAFDDKHEWEYNQSWHVNEDTILMPNKFAEDLLTSKKNFVICCKLFRADLLKNIRFKEGILNEDSVFIFEVSKLVESHQLKLIEIPYCGYFYRQRIGSICHDEVPIEPSVFCNFSKMIHYYQGQKNERMIHVLRHYLILRCLLFEMKIRKNHPSWGKKYHKEVNSFLRMIPITSVCSYGLTNRQILNFLYCKFYFFLCRIWYA